MRAIKYVIRLLLIVFSVPALITLGFWLGLVPARIIPFGALDIARDDQWFVDFRIAALRADKSLCRAVLKAPIIYAEPVTDRPIVDGCGWSNAVAVSQISAARLATGEISCQMAGALAMWLEHSVQPAAQKTLGSKVTGIRHMGVYACRNIVGAKGLKPFRSQHARANAIDIAAFTLTDGRVVSIAKHWRTSGPESAFLHQIHDGACGYFRVAIGPDYNEVHHDHFHLDRGAFKSCR